MIEGSHSELKSLTRLAAAYSNLAFGVYLDVVVAAVEARYRYHSTFDSVTRDKGNTLLDL
jgi:hypothetical protein